MTSPQPPLIVDPTGGDLTKDIKKVCENFEAATGIKVAVRERAGNSVRSDAKAEPLRMKGCGRVDCLCCSKGKPGMCETNSVGYRISCDSCQGAGKFAHYEGETGRNAYTRGLEHMEDLRNEREDKPLWKHCILEHNGVQQSFTMKTLKYFNSCLQRQTNEAVRITAARTEIVILNSRNEWHQAPIVRVVPTTGIHGDQGESQVPDLGGQGGRGAGRGARTRRGMGRGISRGTGAPGTR